MSIIGSNILAGSSGQGGAYEIEQSLRFNSGDSANLTKTFSSAGNRQIFTISFWFKNTQGSSNIASLMFAGNTSDWSAIEGIGTQNIRAYDYNPDRYSFGTTNASFRDPSAWMHLVFRLDNTSSDRTNYAQIWINGVRQSVASQGSGTQNTSGHFFNNIQHYIGNNAFGSYLNGYLAEFHACDGQLKDATDFGEYDNNGVWRPIEYTGSYGTNGFYLKFDPSATNGIGHDHSGNGNNFTANNFTTSGTGTDVMDDTPTNNFATLNPLIGYQAGGLLAPTFSDGNLTVAPQVDSNNNSRVASATLARNPADGGVWRWEMVVNNTNNSFYGIMALNENTGQGSFGPYWGASGLGGNLSTSGGASASLQEQHQTISAGDVIGIKVSFDDNELSFWINGTRRGFYNNCNFSNYDQLVPFFKESTRTQTPCTFDVNFGQKAFQYTTSGDPWGDLSTLPAPDIADGSEYFGTALYAGSLATAATVGATQDVTGLNTALTPDMVWIKNRGSGRHVIFDVLRLDADGDNALRVDSTGTEAANVRGGVSSLNAGGFTAIAGSDSSDNTGVTCQTGNNYVAWAWAEGATQGMDVLTGTGGTAVNHNLGVAPDFVIFKYTNATSDWNVYHKDVTSTNQRLKLNSRAVVESISASWTINSTNFAYGGGSSAWVAYLFSEVEGYSKFGSFTGNGSSDGPFVYCGFRPAWIMLKRATGGEESWQLIDTARSTYNPMTNYMSADTANAEASAVDFWDQLSNGFKLRNGGVYINGSGDTYIFVAFAENPFGGDGVSPATAR